MCSRANGAGLMRFLQLDLDTVLALDPQAHQEGRRLVRLIAGNPVTMGQMTRRLPGRRAAGHRSPQPPAARDRQTGQRNRSAPVPENALAQPQMALNAQALRAGEHEPIDAGR
jgi:hypothetical protein